jgi:hypothetical protein
MYAEQWNDYRKRLGLFWSVLLGGTPFVALCIYVLDQILPGSVSSPATIALPIAVMLTYAVAGMRLTWFRCPRCQNPYFARGLLVNQLAGHCLHCGLEKWQEDEGLRNQWSGSLDDLRSTH